MGSRHQENEKEAQKVGDRDLRPGVGWTEMHKAGGREPKKGLET